MFPPSMIFPVFALLVVIVSQIAFAEDQLTRIDSEFDETSCICGLNKEILDKLQSILSQASASSHSSCPAVSLSQVSSPQPSIENSHLVESSKSPGPNIGTAPGNKKPNLPSQYNEIDHNQSHDLGGGVERPQAVPMNDKRPDSLHPISQYGDGNNPGVGASQPGSRPLSNVIQSQQQQTYESVALTIAKLNAEIQKLEMQLLNSKLSPTPLDQTSTSSSNNGADNDPDDSPIAVNSGFLSGLKPLPGESHNGALMKLNQSQRIDPQEMQNALQSTIPNVVSNIFSSIHNLTIQTAHDQQMSGGDTVSGGDDSSDSGKLTSIDGSTVNVGGNNGTQIASDGEQLFTLWIDHQLESLHLTAAAANYIRKNAIELFRQIVKQYIERMKKVGGSVQANMIKATQMALNNTQNLTAYIMKNYIRFAGGIMRIIGEQVSRIGKKLDSTGDTIAHISLNPFDIVSNVIESLPNPSDYSNYFREFGKKLLGELTSQYQNHNNSSNETGSQQQADVQSTVDQGSGENQRKQGLLIKTMGAVSKTLGSWFG